MERMIEKVTTTGHLSWMGLYKGWSGLAPTHFFGRIPQARIPDEHTQLIFADFLKFGEVRLIITDDSDQISDRELDSSAELDSSTELDNSAELDSRAELNSSAEMNSRVKLDSRVENG